MTRHKTNLRRIKERLKAAGLTHKAAATKCRVGREQLTRVLNGHRTSQRLIQELEIILTEEEASR